ncbi:peptidoglycan-binding domain-containing protein [Nocardiopsis ganjiahuensis]|uniref:peptidoglycan-binding domain-containing protein n=1 Tax=Nocardiopsis ganjiahuensis TaxID=239984 RepID=UPI000345D010|nr:peptidoglycan-binding domain-containing protein [Nocardiopsis ganjiahuensis]
MPTFAFNTCGGAPGHLVTAGGENPHGDAWHAVEGHVAYDERPDRSWPAIRLGSPVAGPSSVELPAAGVSTVSVYLWVPAGGRCVLSLRRAGGSAPAVEWDADALRLGGQQLPEAEDARARGRLVRAQIRVRSEGTDYRLNHRNPELTAPDLEAEGPATGTGDRVAVAVPAGHTAWMIQLRAGSGPWPGSAILRHGSEFTREVTLLQEDLLAAGYELPQFGADGDYGNETVDAVMAFQSDHGLLSDGSVGQESRGVLNALLNSDRYTTPDGHTGWGIPMR